LEEKGVIFARLEDLEGVESYTAVYKGEVLVQGGSAADLRKSLDGAWSKKGDDLVRELDDFVIQAKIDKRAKKFIHKWNQSSVSLLNITKKEMSNAIRGYTPKADEIADMIDKELIIPKIWDDKDFIDFVMADAITQQGMNQGQAFFHSLSVEAFAYGQETVFKASTNPDRLLTQLVHEGTHVLDKIYAKTWLRQGKTQAEIVAKIGTTIDKENRAFINEWHFQKTVGMQLEFKSIEEIKAYVIKNYSKLK
jgi:hypothetical protein